MKLHKPLFLFISFTLLISCTQVGKKITSELTTQLFKIAGSEGSERLAKKVIPDISDDSLRVINGLGDITGDVSGKVVSNELNKYLFNTPKRQTKFNNLYEASTDKKEYVKLGRKYLKGGVYSSKGNINKIYSVFIIGKEKPSLYLSKYNYELEMFFSGNTTGKVGYINIIEFIDISENNQIFKPGSIIDIVKTTDDYYFFYENKKLEPFTSLLVNIATRIDDDDDLSYSNTEPRTRNEKWAINKEYYLDEFRKSGIISKNITGTNCYKGKFKKDANEYIKYNQEVGIYDIPLSLHKYFDSKGYVYSGEDLYKSISSKNILFYNSNIITIFNLKGLKDSPVSNTNIRFILMYSSEIEIREEMASSQ